MGKLVVIEGLDGSGKATQTQLLAQQLNKVGRQVLPVTFPDYESQSSALVRMYLAGEFGSQPDDVNAYAASSFYAVDRYASLAKHWGHFYQRGGLVLADRYTTSNAIHQCAKLPDDQWPEFVDWLADFEYQKLGIPAPDLVICLDVPPELSQQLMLERYGDEAKKDIHERDLEYLIRCRKAAHWCAQRLGWQLVVCENNNAMRTRQEIADEIWAILSREVL